MTPRTRLTLMQLLLLIAMTIPILACGWDPATGGAPGVAGEVAAWNCPTATPPPIVTPPPTRCRLVSPTPDPFDPLATPGPAVEVCDDPAPTATPVPTATPYGRWASPGDHGTTATFYEDQDVRIGPLKLTLVGYTRSGALAGAPHLVAHIFTLDTANEGAAALDIQWPLQTLVREVRGADGTSTAGLWRESRRAEDAAGIAPWDPAAGRYAPGEQRTVTLAIEGPPGVAQALGFLPDPISPQPREGLGSAGHLLWFMPAPDAHCEGNTSGPPRQGDGGAVYPKPIATPPPAQYGYFAGWPVPRNGQVVLTQGFGCTAFREISGYACPDDQPWFHSGIDLADPSRPPVYSVVRGVVEVVGVSPGRVCAFPGAEEPRTNLGWFMQIRVVDATGHAGPFHVKYGHLQVGSQLVQVGDRVAPGQPLARMASTGCSTGVHLHFMVQDESGRFLDPFNFIGGGRGGQP